MKIKDIINTIDGELLSGNYEDDITHIEQDSRNIKRGDTFIAFKGDNFDGNAFVYDAIKNGAKTCIVTSKELKPVSVNIIYVEDAQIALDRLIEYKYGIIKPIVIAITGSVGKTSTRDIMANILSQKFKVFRNEKNFNERRGLPLNAINIPYDTEIAVLEMGMDCLGEISELSTLFKPDFAVITNIGISHIEKLGSKENILKAKLEIINGIKDKGFLVLNADDEYLGNYAKEQKDNMFRTFKMLTYALNNDKSDIVGKLVQIDNDSMSATIKYEDKIFKIDTNLRGKHNIYNMLPGILIGLQLGMNEKEIQKGVEKIPLTERRMDRFTTTNNMTVYDDTYNASLESVLAGLEILKREEGRKVAILGDILELGDFSEEIHRKIGKFINETNINLVITAGKSSQFINEELVDIKNYHFNNAEEVVKNLQALLLDGDAILIKASNGMQFNIIADKLRTVVESLLIGEEGVKVSPKEKIYRKDVVMS